MTTQQELQWQKGLYKALGFDNAEIDLHEIAGKRFYTPSDVEIGLIPNVEEIAQSTADSILRKTTTNEATLNTSSKALLDYMASHPFPESTDPNKVAVFNLVAPYLGNTALTFEQRTALIEQTVNVLTAQETSPTAVNDMKTWIQTNKLEAAPMSDDDKTQGQGDPNAPALDTAGQGEEGAVQPPATPANPLAMPAGLVDSLYVAANKDNWQWQRGGEMKGIVKDANFGLNPGKRAMANIISGYIAYLDNGGEPVGNTAQVLEQLQQGTADATTYARIFAITEKAGLSGGQNDTDAIAFYLSTPGVDAIGFIKGLYMEDPESGKGPLMYAIDEIKDPTTKAFVKYASKFYEENGVETPITFTDAAVFKEAFDGDYKSAYSFLTSQQVQSSQDASLLIADMDSKDLKKLLEHAPNDESKANVLALAINTEDGQKLIAETFKLDSNNPDYEGLSVFIADHWSNPQVKSYLKEMDESTFASTFQAASSEKQPNLFLARNGSINAEDVAAFFAGTEDRGGDSAPEISAFASFYANIASGSAQLDPSAKNAAMSSLAAYLEKHPNLVKGMFAAVAGDEMQLAALYDELDQRIDKTSPDNPLTMALDEVGESYTITVGTTPGVKLKDGAKERANQAERAEVVKAAQAVMDVAPDKPVEEGGACKWIQDILSGFLGGGKEQEPNIEDLHLGKNGMPTTQADVEAYLLTHKDLVAQINSSDPSQAFNLIYQSVQAEDRAAGLASTKEENYQDNPTIATLNIRASQGSGSIYFSATDAGGDVDFTTNPNAADIKAKAQKIITACYDLKVEAEATAEGEEIKDKQVNLLPSSLENLAAAIGNGVITVRGKTYTIVDGEFVFSTDPAEKEKQLKALSDALKSSMYEEPGNPLGKMPNITIATTGDPAFTMHTTTDIRSSGYLTYLSTTMAAMPDVGVVAPTTGVAANAAEKGTNGLGT